jgi:hypothetical protein
MNVFAIILFAGISAATLEAQGVIQIMEPEKGGKLFPRDAAVLDLREPQTSLHCTVKPARPELGFDLAFHAGYEARLRLRDFAGEDNILTAIFRVIPDANPDKPVHFEQKWRVPEIGEDAKGSVSLEGAFAIGEGDYRVDWLIRDRDERVCSAYWKISARMPDKKVTPGLASGTIVSTEADRYDQPKALEGDPGQPLAVAILLNIGPSLPGSAAISPPDSEALLGILRGISRDPRIAGVSITAFNLDSRKVIYKQENNREIDFVGIKRAMGSLQLGTVDVGHLNDRNGEARFLVELAAEQAQERRPDALIFVGPKSADGTGMTRDLLQKLGEARSPVFYLTYTTEPEANPWHDLIGSAVRYWRGHEFNITRPLDLVSAWGKIMSRLGKNNDWQTIHER